MTSPSPASPLSETKVTEKRTNAPQSSHGTVEMRCSVIIHYEKASPESTLTVPEGPVADLGAGM